MFKVVHPSTQQRTFPQELKILNVPAVLILPNAVPSVLTIDKNSKGVQHEHLLVKLRRRWIGPFSIAKVISPVAYRLDMPPTWRIHPIFDVLNLKRFH